MGKYGKIYMVLANAVSLTHRMLSVVGGLLCVGNNQGGWARG